MPLTLNPILTLEVGVEVPVNLLTESFFPENNTFNENVKTRVPDSGGCQSGVGSSAQVSGTCRCSGQHACTGVSAHVCGYVERQICVLR